MLLLNIEVGATGRLTCSLKAAFTLVMLNWAKMAYCYCKRNDVSFFRRNALNIAAGIIEDIPVVDHNAVKIPVQQITQHAGGLGLFTENFAGATEPFRLCC